MRSCARPNDPGALQHDADHSLRSVQDKFDALSSSCVSDGSPFRHRLSRLLTLSEVADLLRISVRTVRRLSASGRLPCIRIGRQLRFRPDDVARQLQAWKE
jgi:excisionase family DNA binding protein